jgi:hypothetical protein
MNSKKIIGALLVLVSILISQDVVLATDTVECVKDPTTGIVECDDGTTFKAKSKEDEKEQGSKTCMGEGGAKIKCKETVKGASVALDVSSIKSKDKQKDLEKDKD